MFFLCIVDLKQMTFHMKVIQRAFGGFHSIHMKWPRVIWRQISWMMSIFSEINILHNKIIVDFYLPYPHFKCVVSLKYHVPDTCHETYTTPSRIILIMKPGRPALEMSVKRGS